MMIDDVTTEPLTPPVVRPSQPRTGSEGLPKAEPPVLALAIENLNAYYGTTHAVGDVTLQVPRGQVTAIIGPSGCGKSTLLRCLNRMHEVIPGARATGRVLIGEVDVYAPDTDPVEVRSMVG